jgi:nucleoside-diphosphate-sugar epimerase
VTDAVAATIAAMGGGVRGAAYNVGGGSETSLLDVIAICEQLSGRPLKVGFEEAAAGDVRRTAADTSAAAADLHWAPQMSLEEGLASQLRWAGLEVEHSAPVAE